MSIFHLGSIPKIPFLDDFFVPGTFFAALFGTRTTGRLLAADVMGYVLLLFWWDLEKQRDFFSRLCYPVMIALIMHRKSGRIVVRGFHTSS